MKATCELMIWYVLPAIRRELAKSLIHEHGLSRKEVAGKLEVTEATISHYMRSKRAKVVLSDEGVMAQISQLAEKLTNGDYVSGMDICKICNSIRSTKVVDSLYVLYTNEQAPEVVA